MRVAKNYAELGESYSENILEIAYWAMTNNKKLSVHLKQVCGCDSCLHAISDCFHMASIGHWIAMGGKIVFIDPPEMEI